MSVYKQIRIKKDTWKTLKTLQLKHELRSLDETIRLLLKKYSE